MAMMTIITIMIMMLMIIMTMIQILFSQGISLISTYAVLPEAGGITPAMSRYPFKTW